MAKKITQEQFIQKSKVVHGDIYDYSLVEYINSASKIKIICKDHGVFEQRASNHMIGIGCSSCVGGVKISTDEFIIRANKKHHGYYDYSLVEYIHSKFKVRIICREHGVFEQSPRGHIFGRGCSLCSKNKKMDTVSFIEKSILKHGNYYDYRFSKYINNYSKVEIVCRTHGSFKQVAGFHISGGGCPKCCRSLGEKKIISYLQEKNIKYKEEFKFPDCRNIKPLPFDFYLMDHNILIEYDGEQHFRPVDYFGGIDGFRKRNNNDVTKNIYAEKNKIPLLRVSYLDKDISDIIDKFIKNHSISMTYNLN